MNDLIENLLPGNYWLTKSMEFSKTGSSGTLWYLKKWFVYYHYIFFKNNLHIQEYQEIVANFDSFINKLDPQLKTKAEEYFFSIDIRTQEFVRFSDFVSSAGIVFADSREEKEFNINAKKYYFMYIMGLGGQSGYKKFIKELIEQRKPYSEVKQTLSEKMLVDGKSNTEIGIQLADFPATIRNERQIFFYYGLFHGRDRADLSGFYNMTRIGLTIIKSGPEELKIIWEHQKLKMISQSPETEINLGGHAFDNSLNYDSFAIKYHPYITLLESIKQFGKLDPLTYQYLIARTKEGGPILEEIPSDLDINVLADKVRAFNRAGDTNSEDFTKEIKKFLLGITNLPLDEDTNLNAIVTNEGEILDADKFNFVLNNYKIITEYLDDIYATFYEQFQGAVKKYYLSQIRNTEYEKDPEALYNWHRYIINFDSNVVINLLYVNFALQKGVFGFNISARDFKESYSEYTNILANIGINSAIEFSDRMIEVQESASQNSMYILSGQTEEDISDIKVDDTIDFSKLKSKSAVGQNLLEERKRNMDLIRALRSFYILNYRSQETKLIKCDSCKNETFLTRSGYPYLEYHHIIPFSTDNGPDHYLNLVGICPDCHRKFTFAAMDVKRELYENLDVNNNPHIELLERINEMYSNGVLEPLNLEFLKKEGIISDQQYEQYMSQEIVSV